MLEQGQVLLPFFLRPRTHQRQAPIVERPDILSLCPSCLPACLRPLLLPLQVRRNLRELFGVRHSLQDLGSLVPGLSKGYLRFQGCHRFPLLLRL
jgi:hypothetical protein